MPKPEKILIVDDEAHVRDYVALLVQSTLGAREIDKAANRAEAVAAFTASRPDLVLLDVNLVGVTGFDILRELRKIDPAAVVVMLTSVSARKAVEEALTEGASGYLLKDTPFQELGEMLRQLVARLFGGATETARPPAP